MSDSLTAAQALIKSMIGRTITDARWWDESPDDTWGHHETGRLTLDDGRTIEFSSYGYDADGATIEDVTLHD